MAILTHNPAGLFPPYRSYSHATEIRGDSRLLIISGLNGYLADGMTMPEMAMRFILNNPDVSTIIPGMRKIKNVESNIAASDRGPLPAALHTELRKHRWDRKPTKWSQ